MKTQLYANASAERRACEAPSVRSAERLARDRPISSHLLISTTQSLARTTSGFRTAADDSAAPARADPADGRISSVLPRRRRSAGVGEPESFPAEDDDLLHRGVRVRVSRERAGRARRRRASRPVRPARSRGRRRRGFAANDVPRSVARRFESNRSPREISARRGVEARAVVEVHLAARLASFVRRDDDDERISAHRGDASSRSVASHDDESAAHVRRTVVRGDVSIERRGPADDVARVEIVPKPRG